MPARRDPDSRLRLFAREMRRQPTEAEKKLWPLLRDRNLGGFKFRRQVPVEGYILDFFCEAASTAVELDGGQHAEPDAIDYDRRRSERLAELRIRVLRFSDHDALKDPLAIARTILRILTTGA
jgi:very-short-patch-repair endonuclease